MRSLILASVFLLALSILFAIACGDDDDDDDDSGDPPDCEDYCQFLYDCFGAEDDEDWNCVENCIENDLQNHEDWAKCFLPNQDDCDAFHECTTE